jgi:alpha-tubulin suppressor-like RCC1 family protein
VIWFNISQGELWGFGDNKHGQLGDSVVVGPEQLSARLLLDGQHVSSVSTGWTHACALTQPNSQLIVWGRNNYHQCGAQKRAGSVVNSNIPLLYFFTYILDP